jgi:hypothetical protein
MMIWKELGKVLEVKMRCGWGMGDVVEIGLANRVSQGMISGAVLCVRHWGKRDINNESTSLRSVGNSPSYWRNSFATSHSSKRGSKCRQYISSTFS